MDPAIEEYRRLSTAYIRRVQDARTAVLNYIKNPEPEQYTNRNVFTTATAMVWRQNFPLNEWDRFLKVFEPGNGAAWVEIIQGKFFPPAQRVQAFEQALHKYYPGTLGTDARFASDENYQRLWMNSHPSAPDAVFDASGFYLRSSDRLVNPLVQMAHEFAKSQGSYQVVDPDNISFESREQMIQRQFAEGAYLFGGIGGLMGGAVFFVNYDVRGDDFDHAVHGGAVVATYFEFLTFHYMAKEEVNRSFEKAWDQAKPSLRYRMMLNRPTMHGAPYDGYAAPVLPGPEEPPKNLLEEVEALRKLALEDSKAGPQIRESTGASPRGLREGDLGSLPRLKGTPSRVLTNAEMETLLRDTLARRPYLARLGRARALDGQALNDEVKAIIEEWKASTQKLHLRVTDGTVKRLGSEGAGGWAVDSISGKEVLIVEGQVFANPRNLLEEVTHELAYEAVWEGARQPALKEGGIRWANDWLEAVIKNGDGVWANLREMGVPLAKTKK